MALVTRAQLAQLKAKVSKSGTCTTQAVKNRKFSCEVMTPTGAMYDTDDREVMKWLTTNSRQKKQADRKAIKADRKPDAAETKPPQRPAPLRRRPAVSDDADPDEATEPEDLSEEFLRVKIEEKNITNAEKRNKLVPISVVRQFIQRIYTADSVELDQMSNRIGGKVSGMSREAPDDATATMIAARIIAEETARIKKHVHQVMIDFIEQHPEEEA